MIGMLVAGPATKVVWGQEMPSQGIPKPEKVTVTVREPLSKNLGWAGVVAAFAGASVLGVWETQYRVLDNEYCVTDYTVDAGPCWGSGQQAKIGALMLGGGVFAAWLGFHKVTKTKTVMVTPRVTNKGFGVSTTVQW
jgi:hypothetical protein